MSELDLEEIKQAEAAATRGPWLVRPNKWDDWGLIRGGDGYPVCETGMSARYTHDDIGKFPNGPTPILENAHFIAKSREWIPALVAEVERLREHTKSLERICQFATDNWKDGE